MCKKEEFNVVNHLNIQTCNAFPGQNDSLGAVTLSAAVYTWGAKLSCEKLRTTPCQITPLDPSVLYRVYFHERIQNRTKRVLFQNKGLKLQNY